MNKYHLKIIDLELINLIEKSKDERLSRYVGSGVYAYAIDEKEARTKTKNDHVIMISINVSPYNELDDTASKINSKFYNGWLDIKIASCDLID